MNSDAFFAPYNEAFYRVHHNSLHAPVYHRVAMALTDALHPQSVIDIGCGAGNLLAEMKIANPNVFVLGVEAPQQRQVITKSEPKIPLTDYRWYDLRTDRTAEGALFDLAISVEVAEHLPHSAMANYLRFLTESSDTLAFSAAKPGQGGVGHINERPFEDWSRALHGLGYDMDITTTQNIQRRLMGQLGRIWWYEYIAVFRRRRT
jgi:SAM-dependent methyltransferase